MIHEDLSGKIIGAAIQVLNELKPGLDEKLYERAIAIELKRRGLIVSVQRSFPVYYGGELIGNLVPDLIVNDAVIVDPKVLHRNARCADDRVPEHHEIGPRPSDQFQKRTTGIEAGVTPY